MPTPLLNGNANSIIAAELRIVARSENETPSLLSVSTNVLRNFPFVWTNRQPRLVRHHQDLRVVVQQDHLPPVDALVEDYLRLLEPGEDDPAVHIISQIFHVDDIFNIYHVLQVQAGAQENEISYNLKIKKSTSHGCLLHITSKAHV